MVCHPLDGGMQSRRGSGTQGGFTLLELLAVMGLMAVVMGLATSALTRNSRGSRLETAQRLVRAALLEARNAARGEGGLARVQFHAGPPAKVTLQRGRDAGTWHFDEAVGGRVLGGGNNFAMLRGASLTPDGTIRGGVLLAPGKTVECPKLSVYEPMAGFSISMDVLLEGDQQGGTVMSYGPGLTFEITSDLGLSTTLDFAGEAKPVTVATPPGMLAPGRWARIELSYDGIEVLLRAFGVVEARKRIVSDVTQQTGLQLEQPGADAALLFGSKTFAGVIDEVRYRTLEDGEVFELDTDVVLDIKEPLELRFDADGRLDSRLHVESVQIPLVYEEERDLIRVDLSGVVR